MVPLTILVRWNEQVHSISYYRTNPPSFEELVKQVNAAFKEIHVASYDFLTKGQHVIHDNQTLQQELLRDSKDNGPEIILHPKSERSNKNKVPVIKPTVLRWTHNQDAIRNHRCSPSSPLGKRTSLFRPSCQEDLESSSDNEDASCTRKDSGVSMENPSKKKQRVKSADTSGTAKISLSTITSRNHTHYSYRNNKRPSSPSPSHNHTIHPLEMRRPSTAPSSPITIKLPALSSITSSTPLDNDSSQPPQLAPLQQSPQRKQFYLPGITSPHPSSIPLSSSETTPIPLTPTTSSSLSPPTPCLEKSHIHHSTFQRQHEHHHQHFHHHHLHRYSYQQHPSQRPSLRRPPHPRHQQHFQQKHVGQFLCEQVMDVSSGRICGQTFRRSYDLSRHQTIHLKNRPFCYCDQCGKKFTRMDALRRHERVQGHASKQHLVRHPDPISSAPVSAQPLSSSSLSYHSSPQDIPYTPSAISHTTKPMVDLRKTQQARV